MPLFRFRSIGYNLDSMKGYFVVDLNSSFYSIYYIIVFILRSLFPTCDKSYSLIGVTERHCDMRIYQRQISFQYVKYIVILRSFLFHK